MGQFRIVIGLVIAVLGYSSIFYVKEGERAIVIQLGQVLSEGEGEKKRERIFEPGLNFKIPFFASVKRLDARIQTLDDQPDRYITAEKKDLIVDSFIKWRISNFNAYYVNNSGGLKSEAEQKLRAKVNDALRTEFGNRTIKEIVSGERTELMQQAIEAAKSSQDDLGIEVLDVRVKQINLPPEVSDYIYERMRTERLKVANAHRSEGREKAEVIRADVDARITVMLAQAEKQSQTLRGEGDALAAKAYADAFNKNPEFFAFVRSLEAYQKSFSSKNDVLVLEPDSDFFKYMKSTSGK